MPRVNCPKCQKTENIQKSGIVRNKQRYNCKSCNYNFTLSHERKNSKKKEKSRVNNQTSLLDIAKALGISVSTVSRALNNHPDISDKTKKSINALAAEWSYQPNALAQSFLTRSTHTIGVIIPNLETTFFSSMLSGIQHVASQAGYRVVICQSDESHQTEVANIQALMNNMIDGLLICHSLNTKTYEHVKIQLKLGIPIVQFYRVTTEVETSRVYCEDEKGAYLITEHLIKQGCKKIALMLAPKHILISENRLKGYLKALKEYGLPFDENLVCNINFDKNSIIESISKWLELHPDLDGIFSISDKSAVQIIQYLKSKNIKIPNEICVAGFGNEYTGEIIEPSLTTFDVNTIKFGETSTRILLDKIINENTTFQDVYIKGDLIIRNSTKRQKDEIFTIK